MDRMSSILALTDFSSPSRHAVERAANLASAAGARLHLLHVVPSSALERLRALLGSDTAPESELLSHAERQLHSILDHVGEDHGYDVRARMRAGAVLREIEAEAESSQADIIVAGAHGGDFLRRLALGTTAERLLRVSKRPVLVVKRRSSEPYQRVLVPVDFSAVSLSSILLARRVAPEATLVLLHAYEVPFEGRMRMAGADSRRIEGYRAQARQTATHQLQATAAAAGLRTSQWQSCLLMDDPSLAIVEQEQEFDCDLIVIGKQGAGVVADFLLGSVTKHVLAESAGDVLVSTVPLKGESLSQPSE